MNDLPPPPPIQGCGINKDLCWPRWRISVVTFRLECGKSLGGAFSFTSISKDSTRFPLRRKVSMWAIFGLSQQEICPAFPLKTFRPLPGYRHRRCHCEMSTCQEHLAQAHVLIISVCHSGAASESHTRTYVHSQTIIICPFLKSKQLLWLAFLVK